MSYEWDDNPDIIEDIKAAKSMMESQNGYNPEVIFLDDINEIIWIKGMAFTYDRYNEMRINAIRACAAGIKLRERLIAKMLFKTKNKI